LSMASPLSKSTQSQINPLRVPAKKAITFPVLP
jgi:hypothetical protein